MAIVILQSLIGSHGVYIYKIVFLVITMKLYFFSNNYEVDESTQISLCLVIMILLECHIILN